MSGKSQIHNGELGADRAFHVVEGGSEPTQSPQPPPIGGDEDTCPVVALGHADGNYHFLDPIGQVRVLTTRDLHTRAGIMALFGGNDEWLKRNFPVEKEFVIPGGKARYVIDYRINDVAQFLISEAFKCGLIGSRTKRRRVGVWRGEDGMPVVHCGDLVLIGNQWFPAGTRTGSQIWVAMEATARPGAPCDFRVAEQLQLDFQQYWNFRGPGSGVALIGLLFSGDRPSTKLPLDLA
jgi:hypothetical protein